VVLDSTINPDFSQIEADMPQIDVNQRYALYYPEKGPFSWRKDYFDTPFEARLSRTIVDPQWGVKLTGKNKGTTLGFLSSMDMNSPEITFPRRATKKGRGRMWKGRLSLPGEHLPFEEGPSLRVLSIICHR
jgi:hypothetical protein